MHKKNSLTIVLALLLSASAFAGDEKAGQQKAMVCAACHQLDGNSLVPSYPKLAGQHQHYLIKQLKDYRTAAQTGGQKGRHNPIMGALAMGLSDKDIEDLAAYYAGQTAKPVVSSSDTSKIERGRKLYLGGDKDRHIAACTACHGAQGRGIGSARFPRLAQQDPLYLSQQLKYFRTGTRANDMNQMMRMSAKKLTDGDIEALTAYISTLGE